MSSHQDSPKVPEAAVELLARFKWEAAKGATWDAADPAWKEPWLNVARKQAYELAPLFLSALLSDEAIEAAWKALPADFGISLDEVEIALQAAIEQVGGAARG